MRGSRWITALQLVLSTGAYFLINNFEIFISIWIILWANNLSELNKSLQAKEKRNHD